MEILNCNHITKQFGVTPVLEDICFAVLAGDKIGMMGVNGAGKTTLFKILLAEMEPDAGQIVRQKNLKLGYMPQQVDYRSDKTAYEDSLSVFSECMQIEVRLEELQQRMEQEHSEQSIASFSALQERYIAEGGLLYRGRARSMLQSLGLSGTEMDLPMSALSGGQRTKVLLGKLLLEKPDILLLDEPTNYLDQEHIEWLRRYLQEYENAFILISHDIPFLNSVVNLIYHMENQRLDRYVGNYDRFLEVHEAKKNQLEAAYKKQQQEIARIQDFVARNKARVATRNMAMSRQKKLDKMDVIELAKEKPKPEFHFLDARATGKTVFETKELVIGYDEPLSVPLSFVMERGEKIAVTGANGIGKTTFLKSILGLIPPLSGSAELGDYLEIGYFEQEMAPGNTSTCIEEIWKEFPSYTQYQVRAALAKCGLTTKNIESQVRVLSGGEQAKVRLCKLLNRPTNFLLLDEPTNHLDVDAKEELRRALTEYKGAVLLICHEPEFYEGLVDKVWDLSRWSRKL